MPRVIMNNQEYENLKILKHGAATNPLMLLADLPRLIYMRQQILESWKRIGGTEELLYYQLLDINNQIKSVLGLI